MAPEDNPADDVQPTEDEWDEFERRTSRDVDDDTGEWIVPPEHGGEG